MTLLRVNTDIIIDTEAHRDDVVEAVGEEFPVALGGFPLGEVVKVDVLGTERVEDIEAHERGWVE
jgi:hypothetical protein